MNNSEKLFQRALQLSPGGVHSPVRAFAQVGGKPVFMQAANGSQITDVDERIYTDYCMAFGPLILGHRHPAVAEAVQNALADGWSFGTAEPWSVELATLIQAKLPWAENIRFVNSGTEAVMSALRLARGSTGRQQLLKFSGCYHGHADSMLVEAGSGMAGIAASAGICESVANDTLVIPLNDSDRLHDVFAKHGDSLAAAIIEPLPANNGLLPQHKSFLSELRSLCTKHGTLLIFDEVISGFRVAFGGCTELTGITPDLVTWGKIIGGGFPVGAYAGRRDLMQHIAPVGNVYQAGTLSANPVAMRAGIATLQQLLDNRVYEQLEDRGALLERLIKGNSNFRVTRQGSVFWLNTLPNEYPHPLRAAVDVPTSSISKYKKLFHHLLDKQIYFAPSPVEVCFLSSAHSEADIQHLADALLSFQPQ